MFEFQWRIPGQTQRAVMLRIHSRRAWLGRKTLLCGEQVVFQRGRFEGIEARFQVPDDGDELHLRMVPTPGSSDWRPALFADGQELPEITGNPPPRIVRPPASLSIPVGLTYLVMFLAVVMSPQTGKILDALYLHFDDRKAVLHVIDPQAPAPVLSVDTSGLATPAREGQTCTARLKARGGSPPYTWSPVKKRWPKTLQLDPNSGELTATPRNQRDYLAELEVHDAAGQHRTIPVAWVVHPAEPPGADWPVVTTLSLPPAAVGQPYEVVPELTGGVQPYTWRMLGKLRLPEGLALDPRAGRIHGTPRKAGLFPIGVRVIDDSYAARRDIVPWMIPVVVTAVCLLGFVGMRRWGVVVYGLLIVVQAGCLLVPGMPPVSVTALGLEVVLWVAGAAHWGRML